jgi:hypothetical protein
MNLSAIIRIPDLATRKVMYAQSIEIATLKAEIEALKKKPPDRVGIRIKGGESTLETAFIKKPYGISK